MCNSLSISLYLSLSHTHAHSLYLSHTQAHSHLSLSLTRAHTHKRKCLLDIARIVVEPLESFSKSKLLTHEHIKRKQELEKHNGPGTA